MSAPTSNQPNQNIPPKKKVNTKAVFLLLLIVIAIGYLIAIHHTSINHNAADTKPNVNTKTSNITAPSLQNFIAYNFSLTNSMQNNEIIQKNGTIYLQISGYFNQFPNSYPQYISGKIYIIYMQIIVYNGTKSESVILPVFTLVNYSKQQYFIYEAQGDIPQLQQLLTLLKTNEFVAVEFYTNTSIQIMGYTVW
ncbi:MAG: hypothetical protein QXE05_11545 [Nitrososphaeria archaeon]|jgi:hypothetical protein